VERPGWRKAATDERLIVETIGLHRVTNLNIVDPGVDRLFSDGRKADIYYGDPPWGGGNVKYWATMAKKMTGANVEVISYEALMDRIFNLIARHVAQHVFLETGLRWEDDLLERMKRIGLKNIERQSIFYGSGKTLYENVIAFGSFTGAVGNLPRLAGLRGRKLPLEAIRPFARPGGIILDATCGMGYSAQAAVDLGMEFRGNELNAARLEKTKARLARGR
jgi:hypothetical protein